MAHGTRSLLLPMTLRAQHPGLENEGKYTLLVQLVSTLGMT